MSSEISFRVVRSGVNIDAAEHRPIRVLPDKLTAGVVYRKAVYPLRLDKIATASAAYYIDVGDRPVDRDLCGFAQGGATLMGTGDANKVGFAVARAEPAAPPLDWYLETNAYGHYVLFDGDSTLLHRVLQVLRTAGLAYLRAASSYRPADNGRTYAWFIRLASEEDDAAVVRGQVARALANDTFLLRASGSDEIAAAIPPSSELPSLKVELGKLRLQLAATQGQQASRIAGLERELAIARASRQWETNERATALHRSSQLTAENNARAVALHDLQNRHEELEKSHATVMRLLEQERKSARQPAARRVPSSGNASSLFTQSALEAANAELASTRVALSDAKATVHGEKQRVASLEMQISEAEARLRQADERVLAAERDRDAALKLAEEEEERHLEQIAAIQWANRSPAGESGAAAESARAAALADDELEAVAHLLRHLLPRIELDRDAIEEIVNRRLHIKASALWTALRTAHDSGGDRRGGGLTQEWAALEGSKWKELRDHISDGHANHFVRVYMLQPAGNIRHLRIRLFFKKEKHQQKRFHSEMDRQWIPYAFRADSGPELDEGGTLYLRLVTPSVPPFEAWLAPG